MTFVDSNMKHWMRQLKIDPDKCCNSAKAFILNDLDEQLGMVKIYLKHKPKKLDAIKYQIGMISAQLTHYNCEEFHGWIASQLTDTDEKVPAIIEETATKWAKCEKELMQEVRGAINTKRSQHWEKTGEML